MAVDGVARLRRVVARALERAGVSEGESLLVACSHGPDSLVLADALLALRSGPVTLVYVDHGLRDAAGGEGEAVRAFAAAAGADGVVVRVVLQRLGRGLEDAARHARYAALDAAADARGVRWIALGHTATDQAETVLGRLLRGAGVAGLAGIPPVRGRYLRPLLEIERREVLAYVAARGLSPSEDAMNHDAAFQRVRVRQQHLPSLRQENAAVDAALVRTARAMREVGEALDWMALRIPARVAAGTARFTAAELSAVPPAVAKRALALHADALGTSLEARHLEALLALAGGATRGTRGIDLPGLTAHREYGDLVLSRRGEPTRIPPQVKVTETGPARGPYTVRTWEPGDRMRPISLRGRSRKLQDLFTDRKIPARLRGEALVVLRESDAEIVWAQHVGLALDAGVTVSLTSP